ncbi:MAG: efflux RND transporter periplasmic adaptor subunit [Qingshengfaniella sp.]
MTYRFCAPLVLAAVMAVMPALAQTVAPVPVRTLQITHSGTHETRQFFGQVQAIDTVDLAFEVGGRLIALDAPEGQRLPAGTFVAQLDPAPFERAVRRAELALAQAERDLTRAEALAARSVASAVQAADAATARDLAQVALEEAEEALADSRLIVPFDALVADRIAPIQSMITPGQPVLRLHDMSETRVQFNLPERLLQHVDALPDIRFEGHLTGRDRPLVLSFREFRAETGEIGQSYAISLAVTDPAEAAALIPGRAVTVRASLHRPDAPIFIAPDAIATLPSGQTVVVAVRDEDGTLIARHVPVRISLPGGSRVAVEGLTPGDEIVVAGAHLLADGQAVTRFTGLLTRTE